MLNSKYTKDQHKNFKLRTYQRTSKLKISSKHSSHLSINPKLSNRKFNSNHVSIRAMGNYYSIERYLTKSNSINQNLISNIIKGLFVFKNNYPNTNKQHFHINSTNTNTIKCISFFNRKKETVENTNSDESIFDKVSSINANNSASKQKIFDTPNQTLKSKRKKTYIRTTNFNQDQDTLKSDSLDKDNLNSFNTDFENNFDSKINNAFNYDFNAEQVVNKDYNPTFSDHSDNWKTDNLDQQNKKTQQTKYKNFSNNQNSTKAKLTKQKILLEIANYVLEHKDNFKSSELEVINTKIKRKKQKTSKKAKSSTTQADHIVRANESQDNQSQETASQDSIVYTKTTVLNEQDQKQKHIQNLIKLEDSDSKTGEINQQLHATNQFLRKRYKVVFWDEPTSILKVIYKDLTTSQFFSLLLIILVFIAACTQIIITHKTTQKTIEYSQLLEQEQKLIEINQNVKLEYIALTSRPNLAKVVLTNPWFTHINRDNEIIVVLPYTKDLSVNGFITNNRNNLNIQHNLLSECNNKSNIILNNNSSINKQDHCSE